MRTIYKKLADITTNMFKSKYVPFISEVEEFNDMMGKSYQNRTEPTIEAADAEFVVNFIQEELDELKEAVAAKDIVGVFDALLDITYVCTGNGALVFGLKDKFMEGYAEVQASNLSKICMTEEDAIETVNVRSKQQGEPCHFEQVGDGYVVYRTRDNKVMKNVKYFSPDLTQFFTQDELSKFNSKTK